MSFYVLIYLILVLLCVIAYLIILKKIDSYFFLPSEKVNSCIILTGIVIGIIAIMTFYFGKYANF